MFYPRHAYKDKWERSNVETPALSEDLKQVLTETFDLPFSKFVKTGDLALRICLDSVGVKHGSQVILPVTANYRIYSCIVQMGATPIVVDVSDANAIISPNTLDKHVNQNTAAILSVPKWGYPGTTVDLENYADERNIPLVSEISEAIGVKHSSRTEGSFGKISCFNTNVDGLINIGQGGVILSNDFNLMDQISDALSNTNTDYLMKDDQILETTRDLKDLKNNIQFLQNEAWDWNYSLIDSWDFLEQVWYKGSVQNNYQTVLYFLKDNVADKVSAFDLTIQMAASNIIPGYEKNKIELLSDLARIPNGKEKFPNATFLQNRIFPLRVDSSFNKKDKDRFASALNKILH